MFICLSSGASPRYRQDILRAIAMPKGARLQFRYDSKWIEQPVKDLLDTNQVRNSPALIAYIDQHDKNRHPGLIPCRFAKLVDALSHGSTVSLTLALEDFAYAEDLAAFNRAMRSASNTLPTWGPNGTITGSYWFDIAQQPQGLGHSTTLATWESTVAQIADRPDFDAESCFYVVDGLYPVGCDSSLSHESGVFELAGGVEYEIRIYHFHPKKTPEQIRLRLAVSTEASSSRRILC